MTVQRSSEPPIDRPDESSQEPLTGPPERRSAGRPGTQPAPVPVPDWRSYLVLSDEALLRQCVTDRFRARGPGGQKRNKTDSAVRLRHRLSGLTGEATESRSQHENRARALRRLRRAIAFRLRAPVIVQGYRPVPEIRPALGKRGGIALGRRDARFLPAVAALLDLLEAMQWRIAGAGRALGVSTASLGRFLASDPEVLRAANERRASHGLRPLRRRD